MDLTQIRLIRVLCHTRAMLYGLTGMGIALDSDSSNKANRFLIRLAEFVRRSPADCYYKSIFLFFASVLSF